MGTRDYQPGEQVPGTVYKVLRLIGAGGMGTVYDVEDTTIGKLYVLKTLHPKLGAREDLARRIQKEARTLARLNHPNIVEVITAGVTGDSLKLPYYLMERLSGQSLRLVLEKRGQLELSHAYHIGIDLLDALDHAHDKGVIHRDVKPDNIFLHRTVAGVTVTKLLDFGIVSMLDAANGETAGRFLGTLRYAAPEQLRGEKPTAKTDVYSAGLVLYEIIAGRGPFDDEGDGHRIAAAHMNQFPLPVSQFVPIPRELDALIMAALAKNPDARPRDAFSFAASLRNLKRRLEGVRSRESTTSRVTAAGMLAPASTPSLPPASLGVEVTPPAGHGWTPSDPASVSSAKTTTLVGMPVPTLRPATSASGLATAVSAPAGPGRAATTNTLGVDTVAIPQQGTEPMGRSWAPEPPPGFGEADTEIQWPLERVATRSDEPQIRSIPAVAPGRRPSRARPLGAIGVAVAVVVVGGLVLAVRGRSDRHPAAASLAPTVAVPSAGQASSMGPSLSAPAPAPAPAAVSASPSAAALAAPVSPSASAVTATSAEASPARPVASSPSPSRPAPIARPKAKATSPAPAKPAVYPSDRPGPGF